MIELAPNKNEKCIGLAIQLTITGNKINKIDQNRARRASTLAGNKLTDVYQTQYQCCKYTGHRHIYLFSKKAYSLKDASNISQPVSDRSPGHSPTHPQSLLGQDDLHTGEVKDIKTLGALCKAKLNSLKGSFGQNGETVL